MRRPTDYDEHHELTPAELDAMPRMFRILCQAAIGRDGFYSYTAIVENAPSVKVLVTLKELTA